MESHFSFGNSLLHIEALNVNLSSLTALILVAHFWRLLALGCDVDGVVHLALGREPWFQEFTATLIALSVSQEVAVAEASQEGWLVSHFEDLLDFWELVSALSNVVLWVQRIIDTARRLCCHVNVETKWPCVEIRDIANISRLATHYCISMMYFTVVMKEIKENITQVYILWYSYLREISELYKGNYH